MPPATRRIFQSCASSRRSEPGDCRGAGTQRSRSRAAGSSASAARYRCLRAIVESVLDEADVRASLAELVARKQASEELAVAPSVEALTRFF